jgi:hypothetical protein
MPKHKLALILYAAAGSIHAQVSPPNSLERAERYSHNQIGPALGVSAWMAGARSGVFERRMQELGIRTTLS